MTLPPESRPEISDTLDWELALGIWYYCDVNFDISSTEGSHRSVTFSAARSPFSPLHPAISPLFARMFSEAGAISTIRIQLILMSKL